MSKIAVTVFIATLVLSFLFAGKPKVFNFLMSASVIAGAAWMITIVWSFP